MKVVFGLLCITVALIVAGCAKEIVYKRVVLYEPAPIAVQNQNQAVPPAAVQPPPPPVMEEPVIEEVPVQVVCVPVRERVVYVLVQEEQYIPERQYVNGGCSSQGAASGTNLSIDLGFVFGGNRNSYSCRPRGFNRFNGFNNHGFGNHRNRYNSWHHR